MYTYVFTRRRRCRRRTNEEEEKEKDEPLAHMQAQKNAHFAWTSSTRKKSNYNSLNRKKESYFLGICTYTYVCNDVIVTSMPLPSATAEQINVYFAFLFSRYMYVERKKKERNRLISSPIKIDILA